MAHYKNFENHEEVLIEQNIFDNNEIESYEAKMDFNGVTKTSILYYFEMDNRRFYNLGILENENLKDITIVKDDLTDIFKFKTAKTRRKYIYQLIRENILMSTTK